MASVSAEIPPSAGTAKWAGISANARDRLRRIARWARHEPLVLFVVLGFGLFALYGVVHGNADDPASKTIHVDRQALADYMQARARSYDNKAVSRLDAMPAAQVASLVKDYVREEAMYREALSLGLEQKDFLIRERLVQSLQFMFQNLGESGDPADSDLRAFYAANRTRYAEPAAITFDQVFFDKDLHGWDGAERLARETMASLNSGAGEAVLGKSWPGDRFAYNLSYADRDQAAVADVFGDAMARQLFAASADAGRWQGPFRSASGVHLVRIQSLEPGATLPFDQVRGQVARDYREWQGARLERIAVDNLVKEYNVSVSHSVRSLMHGSGG